MINISNGNDNNNQKSNNNTLSSNNNIKSYNNSYKWPSESAFLNNLHQTNSNN